MSALAEFLVAVLPHTVTYFLYSETTESVFGVFYVFLTTVSIYVENPVATVVGEADDEALFILYNEILDKRIVSFFRCYNSCFIRFW